MKLYELAQGLAEVQRIAEADPTPEDLQALEDTLQGLRLELKAKVDGIAAIDRGLSLEADALRAEESRLADRRKSVEAARERLKSYLQRCLEHSGERKVVGERFTVWLQSNPPSVVVPDEEAVPEQYKRVRVDVDRRAITEALKGGLDVPWATLKASQGVRIR